MMRGKRPLEVDGNNEEPPEEKRQRVPQLASVIVEALKVDSLQKLCSSLEPILRRVVSEEVERALAKLGPAKLSARASPKRIEGPGGKNLQLHFRTRLSLPLFTGAKVEGEQGAAIHVVMLDANTGQVVTSGPEASAKLDIIVLEGDFNNEDGDNWTHEDFESHEVKEREGKRPLLTGDLQVTLKEGVGTVGDLIFTDNSSWIRSRKFRLGLKVAAGYCEGIRVREAKTEAFTVKDHRGELYKKHYPPALNDEVWRLDKIGKDGAFHKKLNKHGINTVEDFLKLVVTDPQKLRNILGSGMSNKMWESTVEHAKTCVLSGKLYVYYNDEAQSVGVVFNKVYELRGLIANQQYFSAESLSDNQKVFVDTLVKKAYDNWMSVVEYDGKALVGPRSNKKGSSSSLEASMHTLQYANNTYNHQAPLTCEPVGVQADQASANAALTGGVSTSSGYSEGSVTKFASQPQQQIITNDQVLYGNLPYNLTNHLALSGVSYQNALPSPDSILALGPPQSTISTVVPYQSMGTVMQLGSTNGVEDWSRSRDNNRGQMDDILSVEEIRSKSLEMLGNEEMQHELLRMFSMGPGSVNLVDDSYPYSAFSPATNYGLNEDRTRGSGKAVVGWLKLKAALRWGIFIRKIAAEKAAEKRAQLEELD